MQHLSEPNAEPDAPASETETPRRKPRSRMTTACDACRARRTKCDGRRPACAFCRSRHVECHYEQTTPGPNSRVEAELAAINQRLDNITSLLPASQRACCIHGNEILLGPSQAAHVFTGQEKLPFQLLGTECMMTILGLESGFARELVRLEKNASLGLTGDAARLRVIRQQLTVEALAAFSAYVHVWYPVLRPGFSERYFSVIAGPLIPCPESCLVLLVAAIGTVAQQDHALGGSRGDNASEHYLEVAMASLPSVLIDSSVESVQCLVLLSIYYCCLSRPWQAYEYAMIASFKVQNLLKGIDDKDGELHEHAKRAYWAVLLLESELRVQFDVVQSGIWDHDDQIELPDSRRTWQFDVEMGSPESIIATPASNISVANHSSDRTHSYFLAEIAMRRMLHRCNTAIRRTPQGEIVYAPNIALELELQLEAWLGYLPEVVRFQDSDFQNISSPANFQPIEPLNNFLRVQYYCCKISIYWPAVYQVIQDGTATADMLTHCERFFNAYIQLMPSMLVAIRDCIVNRWTLYASIFMTTMAVVLGTNVPCLATGCAVDWALLLACVKSAVTVDRRIVQASPSLSLLEGALTRRLADIQDLGT